MTARQLDMYVASLSNRDTVSAKERLERFRSKMPGVAALFVYGAAMASFAVFLGIRG